MAQLSRSSKEYVERNWLHYFNLFLPLGSQHIHCGITLDNRTNRLPRMFSVYLWHILCSLSQCLKDQHKERWCCSFPESPFYKSRQTQALIVKSESFDSTNVKLWSENFWEYDLYLTSTSHLTIIWPSHDSFLTFTLPWFGDVDISWVYKLQKS